MTRMTPPGRVLGSPRPRPDARAPNRVTPAARGRLGRAHGNHGARVLTRPEGRAGWRDLARDDRRRGRAPPVPRLPDRRARRARHVRAGRRAAVDRRMADRCAPRLRPAPRGGARGPATPATVDRRDGRAAHGDLGLGSGQRHAVAAHRRAGPCRDRGRALGIGRLRAPARRPRTGRARPVAGPGGRVPPAGSGRGSGRAIGARARRVLRRRRRARLQRLDLHGARDHQHPQRRRLGGGRRDRRAEGSMARRRAVGRSSTSSTRWGRWTRPRPGSAGRWRAASG